MTLLYNIVLSSLYISLVAIRINWIKTDRRPRRAQRMTQWQCSKIFFHLHFTKSQSRLTFDARPRRQS
jgi:hypothetical protein